MGANGRDEEVARKDVIGANERESIIQSMCFRLLSFCLCVLGLTAKATGRDKAERLFTLKVLPLLKAKCFGCHGNDAKEIRGEFNVKSRAGLLKGGESGNPSIVPGKPKASSLYRAVMWQDLEMPPKKSDQLTRAQTESIRLWIKAGAPWPDAKRQLAIRKKEWSIRENAEGLIVSTSGGLSDEWTYRRYKRADLWAFQPVKRPQVPAGYQNPIDAFVDRKLQAAGLVASRRADLRTLIRRATFDLTGLPPTPGETRRFLKESKENRAKAWHDLIDRLLASKCYGERWGRHWLDVTRYADTGGMSNDFERSNMWRYRDYVIRAFNQDKPYDQFIIEQLAGDELADLSVRKRKKNQKVVRQTQLSGKYTNQEAEWLVATGFLRVGPWDNAMVETAEARQIYIDDLVNVVGQTFLATTLRCCKCVRSTTDEEAGLQNRRRREAEGPHLPAERLQVW